jgi:hypothetical protein
MTERLILYGIVYGVIAPLVGLIAFRLWPKSKPARPLSGRSLPIIDAIAILIAAGAVLITALDMAPVDGDMNWIQTLNLLFGPTLHVLRGGIPMIDVFCQYGFLPYLLFSLAFVTAFAPSYPAASLVT